jgi:hypothetical protein
MSANLKMPRLQWAAASVGSGVGVVASGTSPHAGRYELITQLMPGATHDDVSGQGVRFDDTQVDWNAMAPMRYDKGLLNACWQPAPPQRRAEVDRLAALARDLQSIRFYSLSPVALRTQARSPDSEAVPLLDPRGANLPAVLAVLSAAYPERRRRIDELFAAAVPSLAGVRALPAMNQNWRLAFTLAGGGGDIEADQVSDGALLFLAFLLLLEHPDAARVLLIEEPENGVHPSRLKEIVALLRKLTAPTGDRVGTQIVVTTHSPYLLDEMRPEEAYFCVRQPDGAARALRFSEVDQLDERLADYSLGELWTTYGEERLQELVKSP